MLSPIRNADIRHILTRRGWALEAKRGRHLIYKSPDGRLRYAVSGGTQQATWPQVRSLAKMLGMTTQELVRGKDGKRPAGSAL